MDRDTRHGVRHINRAHKLLRRTMDEKSALNVMEKAISLVRPFTNKSESQSQRASALLKRLKDARAKFTKNQFEEDSRRLQAIMKGLLSAEQKIVTEPIKKLYTDRNEHYLRTLESALNDIEKKPPS